MTTAHELTEHVTAHAVPLTRAQRTAIAAVAPSVSVAPSVASDDHYDLTPASYVGVVTVPHLTLTIRPKFPMANVFFLISYSLDPSGWRDEDFAFARDDMLVEAVARGFLRAARKAVRRGLLHDYQTVEERLQTVRGRVQMPALVSRHFGRFPPIDVTYDDYTHDIEHNRVLRAALVRLLRMPLRAPDVVSRLRALDAAFDGVALVEYDHDRVPEIVFTRLTEHYRPAVSLARLILRSSSLDMRHGNVTSSALLVNMNEVFESFVVTGLREVLCLSEREFPHQAKGVTLRLDRARKVRLEPDMSWWRGDQCVFVGDVKYKRTTVSGINHPDLYQALAYAVAARVGAAMLVYAHGEAEAITHDVDVAGKRLLVRTLDLSGTPAALLGQIAGVARTVRALADEDAPERVAAALGA